VRSRIRCEAGNLLSQVNWFVSVYLFMPCVYLFMPCVFRCFCRVCECFCRVSVCRHFCVSVSCVFFFFF